MAASKYPVAESLPTDPQERYEEGIRRLYCRRCTINRCDRKGAVIVKDGVFWGPYCPFRPCIYNECNGIVAQPELTVTA